jgi:hypothetical protein
MVSFACDFVPAPLVRPDPKEFVFLGKVMAPVGPLSSPKFKFSGAVWGVKVAVEEAVHLPQVPKQAFEVVPYTDCNWGGFSEDQIKKSYPVGSQVLVVATLAQFLTNDLPDGNLRLERLSNGRGFVASSRILPKRSAADFNYRGADIHRAQYELRRDLQRLESATTKAQKTAVLGRLLLFPCCTNVFDYSTIFEAYAPTPLRAAQLIRDRQEIERKEHEAWVRRNTH